VLDVVLVDLLDVEPVEPLDVVPLLCWVALELLEPEVELVLLITATCEEAAPDADAPDVEVW
jgi:hypothetical protein